MKIFFLILILLGLARSYLKAGEFTYVEDIKDNEIREKTANEYVHVFEDFNFSSLDQKIFLKYTKNELARIMTHYNDEFEKIIENKEYNNNNVGPHFMELFGKDFVEIKSDMKDLEVDIKAFIEKQIDMFFLYKCQNKYFNENEKFPACKKLKNEVKKKTMFDIFFDFGFKNMILDLLKMYPIDDDFNYLLQTKLENIRINWKLFMNIMEFSKSQIIETIKRKITKTYGAGINVDITVDRNNE
jgi:hypothetical protein